MEHTPTPWYFDGDGVYSNEDCEGAPLAHVLSMGYDNDFRNIDARRIVACVNACRGIRTEALEHRVHLLAAEDDTISLLNAQLESERASLFAENQRKQQLEQQVAELVGALENVMPWVVAQEVACHGLKCREPVCMSCSSDSEEAAEKATYAYEEARAVIQKVRGGE